MHDGAEIKQALDDGDEKDEREGVEVRAEDALDGLRIAQLSRVLIAVRLEEFHLRISRVRPRLLEVGSSLVALIPKVVQSMNLRHLFSGICVWIY